MDRALYLVRVITNDVYKNLLALPPHKRFLTSTLGYMPLLEFPGVYFTLVTQNTLLLASYTLYPGDVALILSKRLLEQRNYHFNINDDCGHLSDKNTVFSWQLSRFLKNDGLVKSIDELDDDYVGNEVVFHDPVPWRYVVGVIPKYKLSEDEIPSTPFVTDAEPDMTLKPFFVHPPRNLHLVSLKFMRALASTVDPVRAQTMQTKSEIAEFLRTCTDIYYDQSKRAVLKLNSLKGHSRD